MTFVRLRALAMQEKETGGLENLPEINYFCVANEKIQAFNLAAKVLHLYGKYKRQYEKIHRGVDGGK